VIASRGLDHGTCFYHSPPPRRGIIFWAVRYKLETDATRISRATEPRRCFSADKHWRLRAAMTTRVPSGQKQRARAIVGLWLSAFSPSSRTSAISLGQLNRNQHLNIPPGLLISHRISDLYTTIVLTRSVFSGVVQTETTYWENLEVPQSGPTMATGMITLKPGNSAIRKVARRNSQAASYETTVDGGWWLRDAVCSIQRLISSAFGKTQSGPSRWYERCRS
jgi:hypothetical protein